MPSLSSLRFFRTSLGRALGIASLLWGGAAAAETGGAVSAPAPSLTLAQAEALGLKSQPTLLQARGQTEAAAGRVEEARSGYLPQVTATASYQRTTGNFAPRPGSTQTLVTPPTWTDQTYNYYSLGATASQLLYDFGQTSGRWRAAAVSRDASELAEGTAQVQVLFNLRKAYFLARAQRDLVTVAQETVRNQGKHLGQIERFVQAGIRPEIDLAAARTNVANAEVQLVAARNALEVALAQLDVTMGLPASTRFEPADSEMPPVPGEAGDAAALIEQALRTRPELASLANQKNAQELTLRSLCGGYGPSLGAVAGVSDTGTSADHLVPNWYVGLALSWPLLQGGLTRGQIREASGTLASLGAQEQAQRLQVGIDVEQARLAVAAAKASIQAAAQALTNAREQLRLAEGRYQSGMGSIVELDDAQVAFTNAGAQDVQARYGLASARAQLLAAMGVR